MPRLPFVTAARGALVLLLAAGAAAGQSEMLRWARGTLGDAKPSVDYDATLYLERDVKNQPTDLAYEDHEALFRVPVLQDKDREWAVDAGLRAMDFHTDMRLPDTGEAFPDALWDVHLATTYRWRVRDDWVAGVRAEVSGPSDKPFHTIDETAADVTASLRVPAGDRDAWLFLLNYASNREFLPHVPIPGVAYWYAPSRDFQALLGVPVMAVRYRPLEALALDAMYRIPRAVSARVTWTASPDVDLFAGFAWDSTRFFRADRADEDDRLFYYEKRVEGGLAVDLGEHARLGLTGGYAFDRSFFEGEDYDERGRNRIEVADGAFVTLKVAFRF